MELVKQKENMFYFIS